MSTEVRLAAPAALLACVTGLACATGSAAPPDHAPPSQLRLSLTVGDEPPTAGSPITLELTLVNEGDAVLVLDFPDAQRFDFEVVAEGGAVVWRWAEGRFFAQVLGRETLDAGASLNWTARIESGLPAGTYRLAGTLTTVERQTVENTLTVLPGADAP